MADQSANLAGRGRYPMFTADGRYKGHFTEREFRAMAREDCLAEGDYLELEAGDSIRPARVLLALRSERSGRLRLRAVGGRPPRRARIMAPPVTGYPGCTYHNHPEGERPCPGCEWQERRYAAWKAAREEVDRE